MSMPSLLIKAKWAVFHSEKQLLMGLLLTNLTVDLWQNYYCDKISAYLGVEGIGWSIFGSGASEEKRGRREGGKWETWYFELSKEMQEF